MAPLDDAGSGGQQAAPAGAAASPREPWAEGVATALEAELARAGTAERAAHERRYLRSRLEHLGASVPQVRAAVRAHLPASRIAGADDLLEVVAALWSVPVHERRLAAAVALQDHRRWLRPAHLPVLRTLIREARTWALVDVLADKAAGEVVLREPQAAIAHLDGWAQDGDLWVRRGALLAMLPSVRAGSLPDRFWDYADAMLEEREFFVAKALGWVLREHAKRAPQDVAAWLDRHRDRASPVTVREAARHLTQT